MTTGNTYDVAETNCDMALILVFCALLVRQHTQVQLKHTQLALCYAVMSC
jgi:hypothetical protein